MKTIIQQVNDSLYYLNQVKALDVADSARHLAQGISILNDIVDNNPDEDPTLFDPDLSPTTYPNLKGRRIAFMAGHEPNGGTTGERAWNLKVCDHLNHFLADAEAVTYLHTHTITDYPARQQAMTTAVNSHLPNPDCVLELHYDAVDVPASGHHFQYRSFINLATAIRDAFESQYPSSFRRYDAGLFHNTSDSGSGFLRAAPGPASLLEPFMNSDADSHAFFLDRQREYALVLMSALNSYFA